MQQDPTHPTGVRDDSPRGNSTVARARERKSRGALALSMRTDEILPYDKIAEILGYPSGAEAQRAAERAAEAELKTQESRAFMRRLASRRLEKMLESVFEAATDPDHPDHFAAQNQALKIMAQHEKLQGYQAPVEFVDNNPAAKVLESWITRMLAGTSVDVEQADVFSEQPYELGPGEVEESEAVFTPDPVPERA